RVAQAVAMRERMPRRGSTLNQPTELRAVTVKDLVPSNPRSYGPGHGKAESQHSGPAREAALVRALGQLRKAHECAETRLLCEGSRIRRLPQVSGFWIPQRDRLFDHHLSNEGGRRHPLHFSWPVRCGRGRPSRCTTTTHAIADQPGAATGSWPELIPTLYRITR